MLKKIYVKRNNERRISERRERKEGEKAMAKHKPEREELQGVRERS